MCLLPQTPIGDFEIVFQLGSIGKEGQKRFFHRPDAAEEQKF